MPEHIGEIFTTSYMWLWEHMFLINVIFSFLIIFFSEKKSHNWSGPGSCCFILYRSWDLSCI